MKEISIRDQSKINAGIKLKTCHNTLKEQQ